MAKGRNAWMGACVAIGAALIGCGSVDGSRRDAQEGSVGSQSSALWGCTTKSSKVVCTAGIAAATPQTAAYVCRPDERGATCPDPTALKSTPGLDNLLKRAANTAAFTTMPWACLVTGKHQLQCAREIVLRSGTGEGGGGEPTGPDDRPATPTPAGGDGNGSTTGGTTGDGTKPAAPPSCGASAWEPYFAELATYEYKKHGVAITFPRNIFDTTKPLVDFSIAGAIPKTTPGAPSCHEGEWEMRQQSWLDAVGNGCQALNDAILVLCQEAANYAPSTGECNATGTW